MKLKDLSETEKTGMVFNLKNLKQATERNIKRRKTEIEVLHKVNLKNIQKIKVINGILENRYNIESLKKWLEY